MPVIHRFLTSLIILASSVTPLRPGNICAKSACKCHEPPLKTFTSCLQGELCTGKGENVECMTPIALNEICPTDRRCLCNQKNFQDLGGRKICSGGSRCRENLRGGLECLWELTPRMPCWSGGVCECRESPHLAPEIIKIPKICGSKVEFPQIDNDEICDAPAGVGFCRCFLRHLNPKKFLVSHPNHLISTGTICAETHDDVWATRKIHFPFQKKPEEGGVCGFVNSNTGIEDTVICHDDEVCGHDYWGPVCVRPYNQTDQVEILVTQTRGQFAAVLGPNSKDRYSGLVCAYQQTLVVDKGKLYCRGSDFALKISPGYICPNTRGGCRCGGSLPDDLPAFCSVGEECRIKSSTGEAAHKSGQVFECVRIFSHWFCGGDEACACHKWFSNTRIRGPFCGPAFLFGQTYYKVSELPDWGVANQDHLFWLYKRIYSFNKYTFGQFVLDYEQKATDSRARAWAAV